MSVRCSQAVPGASGSQHEADWDFDQKDLRLQQKALNSGQIKDEIKRFESVHPCIYQVYDILDYLSEEKEKPHRFLEMIRQQVLLIEDSFVNSHEWTLSRSVTELRIGVLGANNSGKSALIHRYLTGKYTAEETPEGGRYKKEIVVDGQSYLLLIRDEGNSPPDAEFSLWADVVLMAFSVHSEESFDQIDLLYKNLGQFRKMQDFPLILVGTKDTIAQNNPRQILEQDGRKKAMNLGRSCTYIETSAPAGHNIERVFKDTARRAIDQRRRSLYQSFPVEHSLDYQDLRTTSMQPPLRTTYNEGHLRSNSAMLIDTKMSVVPPERPSSSIRSDYRIRGGNGVTKNPSLNFTNGFGTRSSAALLDTNEMSISQATNFSGADTFSASTSHLHTVITPGSTPTTQRKKRISSLFSKRDNGPDDKPRNVDLGQGRAIPCKQGHLYKRTKATLNREWKKKYVCIYSDGRLVYYPHFKDFMENKSTGKEVFLGLCTVRVAGRQQTKPSKEKRPSSIATAAPGIKTPEQRGDVLYISDVNSKETNSPGGSDEGSPFAIPAIPTSSLKKSKKKGSGSSRSEKEEEQAAECFEIISHDLKHWEFAVTPGEDRDSWVLEAERQIGNALETVMGEGGKKDTSSTNTNPSQPVKAEVATILRIPGNDRCADCNSTNHISWISLNLGIVICIECAGIHRELGVHISRVRSLTLDNTQISQLAVVLALGNETANQLWEHHAPRDAKPKPDSSREEKELWIKTKYIEKKFLPSVRVDETLANQVVQAVLKKDVAQLSLLLTRAQRSDINGTVSPVDLRTPLHLACSNGSLETLQLLIWNNADPKALDENGRSGLWYALQGGNAECVNILHSAGLSANYGVTDPRLTAAHR
ncbi:unnamed protein product, partial [Mesorhabditis spiculigera]